MLVEVERPDGDEPLLVVGNPIKLSETPEAETTRWPTLGQHTEAILNEDLGMSAGEIEGLLARGIIRGGPTP